MRRSCKLLVLLVLGGLSIAAASPQDDLIAKLTSSEIERGRQMFVAHCAVCHGIEGTGERGPSLSHPSLRRVTDDKALFNLIQNGVEGSEMPGAWQLSEREVWQVAGYVRSLGRTTPVKLPGDAANGKRLYESNGCAACHIVSGSGGVLGPELTDIGARRSPGYLHAAVVDPASSAPEGYLVVRVTTRESKKIWGVRVNEDSFTIQLRDSGGRFHSFRKTDITQLKKDFKAELMPSYRDAFNRSEMDDLVAYLAGLRGEQ
ncbi:MAG: c-type cytochrome [Acidobacteriota bacterium]